LFAPLFLFCAGVAQAQTGRITGTVTDSMHRQPVNAVTISIPGTNLGASTDDNGRYSIGGVPAGTHTLELRRLGYAPVRRAGVVVTADQTTTVDFFVAATLLRLQETVITGVVDPTAGTKVPFSVGRVTKEDAPIPPINAIAGVQGKIAGVMSVPPGQPGDGVSIQLRTPSSISKSNSPLIVVDGVILTESSADINSLDIESVEVVKGAAGTSLYGSRAGAGVIQIRTSRGTDIAPGQTRFTVRSEYGMASLGSEVQWARYHPYKINAAGEYVTAVGDTVVPRSRRVERPAATRFQDQAYISPIYDPVKTFFDPGDYVTNSFTVAQNGDKTNFLTTLSRQDQEGIVQGYGAYERTDLRINLDHRPRDDVRLSISGYHSRADRDEILDDAFFYFIHAAPDVDLKTPPADGKTRYSVQPDPLGIQSNPLYHLDAQDRHTQRVRTLGNLDLNYTPLGWLTLSGNASYDRSDRNRRDFVDRGVKTNNIQTEIGGPGSIDLSNDLTSAVNASGSASVLQQFGALTARSTFRSLIELQQNKGQDASGSNLVVAGVPRIENALTRGGSSTQSEIKSAAYFLTLGLDYDSRMILDGLVRRDASSLFGPGEKWHTYYRASAAYRLAEEAWWPLPRVNEFKLRASRGTAGGRPSFADQYETYTISSTGALEKGTLGNRFLKPEHSTETEIGLDAIMDNRYSLQLSYANNKTTDQIVSIPLQGPIGFTSQWQNAGTVVGHTFEATIEAEVFRRGTALWKVGFIADRSRHHISEFDRSCVRSSTISYRCVGEDLSTMYGYEYLHSAEFLPESQRAYADSFQVNDDGLLVAVGTGSYRDGKWGTNVVVNGITYPWGMRIIRQDSTGQPAVVRIGSGNPDFHWGISNRVEWKGIQLYALLDSQVGGDIYNQTNQRMYQYYRSSDVDQVGKPDELKKPIDYYAQLYNGNIIADWFVEDGSYVKLREVSARYQIPQRFMSRFPGSRAVGVSLSVIGRNLMTWTNYSGYDPEVGTVTNRLDSYDGGYPQSRTFTGVLQFQF
jgi:TonB-linked SusC/RagA family outer membrane protein